MPVGGLWLPGWYLARQFVTAWNIATRGFWWWHLPEQTHTYYEEIEDLETGASLVVTGGPAVAVSWGENLVLTEGMVRLAMMCMGAIPLYIAKHGTQAFDRYIAGLTMLSVVDVHLRCEAGIFMDFLAALRTFMVASGEVTDQRPFVDAFSQYVTPRVPVSESEGRKRLIDFVSFLEAAKPIEGVTLADAGTMKVLCDTYFVDTVAPEFWLHEESKGDTDGSAGSALAALGSIGAAPLIG